MLGKKEIAAVERRAAAARLTMSELCVMAKVHHSTWSRAKTRGSVRVAVVRKMEAQLDIVEAQRAAA